MNAPSAGPWMACASCEVMWRGDHLACWLCGHAGTRSNGPMLRGAATIIAAVSEEAPCPAAAAPTVAGVPISASARAVNPTPSPVGA